MKARRARPLAFNKTVKYLAEVVVVVDTVVVEEEVEDTVEEEEEEPSSLHVTFTTSTSAKRANCRDMHCIISYFGGVIARVP